MPKVKDLAGNVVAELPYTDEGVQEAEQIVDTNPTLEIDYSPGGMYDATNRVQNIPGYFGGGMVADYMGGYRKGGKVEKKK